VARQQWSIISNHGMVLMYLAVNPRSTAREIAGRLDITERQVYRIVRDLEAAALLNVHRGKGGRNTYRVQMDSSFRQHAPTGMTVGHLVETLAPVMLNGNGHANGHNL
jgi:DNA-binding MarR family transcriptional regulator